MPFLALSQFLVSTTVSVFFYLFFSSHVFVPQVNFFFLNFSKFCFYRLPVLTCSLGTFHKLSFLFYYIGGSHLITLFLNRESLLLVSAVTAFVIADINSVIGVLIMHERHIRLPSGDFRLVVSQHRRKQTCP